MFAFRKAFDVQTTVSEVREEKMKEMHRAYYQFWMGLTGARMRNFREPRQAIHDGN